MFLAVILVCDIEGLCKFKSLEHLLPNKFVCDLLVEEGVTHFEMQPRVDYAEGRCIRWGNLIGDKS
jgi:hypothetical protein